MSKSLSWGVFSQLTLSHQQSKGNKVYYTNVGFRTDIHNQYDLSCDYKLKHYSAVCQNGF